jgi:DNA-binding response OmpR family regulator
MLPGTDGLAICRAVRANGGPPVILLTARDREEERVGGFEIGADDFVPKPFSPRELVARVAAVLRRVPPEAHDVLVRGALQIDLARREAALLGVPIELTNSEFLLLVALARRPGRVLSRSQLLDELPGGSAQALDRTVDVHIRNLRRKLETNPSSPQLIQTVVGAGYKLVDESRRTT